MSKAFLANCSVARLGHLLLFGQLFKFCGYIMFAPKCWAFLERGHNLSFFRKNLLGNFRQLFNKHWATFNSNLLVTLSKCEVNVNTASLILFPKEETFFEKSIFLTWNTFEECERENREKSVFLKRKHFTDVWAFGPVWLTPSWTIFSYLRIYLTLLSLN